jgi:hypothetical protein
MSWPGFDGRLNGGTIARDSLSPINSADPGNPIHPATESGLSAPGAIPAGRCLASQLFRLYDSLAASSSSSNRSVRDEPAA